MSSDDHWVSFKQIARDCAKERIRSVGSGDFGLEQEQFLGKLLDLFWLGELRLDQKSIVRWGHLSTDAGDRIDRDFLYRILHAHPSMPPDIRDSPEDPLKAEPAIWQALAEMEISSYPGCHQESLGELRFLIADLRDWTCCHGKRWLIKWFVIRGDQSFLEPRLSRSQVKRLYLDTHQERHDLGQALPRIRQEAIWLRDHLLSRKINGLIPTAEAIENALGTHRKRRGRTQKVITGG